MKFILIALVVFPMLMSCGKDGRDGVDGQDGTSVDIKTIKFCTNLVDQYGVAYSERGLCVDGKPFAIYSANGMASLVELSNGDYITTSPSGENCTFTVDENTCK